MKCNQRSRNPGPDEYRPKICGDCFFYEDEGVYGGVCCLTCPGRFSWPQDTCQEYITEEQLEIEEGMQ